MGGKCCFFTIRNCEFKNNWAFQEEVESGCKVNGTFDNCQFTSNKTGGTGSGGAIWSDDSNLTLRSCAFVSNKSRLLGGALRVDDGNLTLSDCIVSNNESSFSNGERCLSKRRKILMKELLFFKTKPPIKNWDLDEGCFGFYWNSNFTENQNVTSNGGGALFIKNSSPTISSCRFIKNKTDANNYGGAIKLVNSNATIENSTFNYNQTPKIQEEHFILMKLLSPPWTIIISVKIILQPGVGQCIVRAMGYQFSMECFLRNWADYGGGVATNGTTQISFEDIKDFRMKRTQLQDRGRFSFSWFRGGKYKIRKLRNCRE